MKNALKLSFILLLVGFLAPSGASAADPVVGFWKGTVDFGAVRLRLIFKIAKTKAGDFEAKMDSVDQGATDVLADAVTVSNRTVWVEFHKISGEFYGRLDEEGKKLSGEWIQGPARRPLEMVKSETPTFADEPESLAPAELAANKQAAEKLAGNWEGSMATGAQNLRVVLRVTRMANGMAAGVMESLDQGGLKIPLNGLTLRDGRFHFQARGVAGSYDGTLSAEGDKFHGLWRQLGNTVTLDLRKQTEK